MSRTKVNTVFRNFVLVTQNFSGNAGHFFLFSLSLLTTMGFSSLPETTPTRRSANETLKKIGYVAPQSSSLLSSTRIAALLAQLDNWHFNPETPDYFQLAQNQPLVIDTQNTKSGNVIINNTTSQPGYFPSSTSNPQQHEVNIPSLTPNNSNQVLDTTFPPAIFPNQSGNSQRVTVPNYVPNLTDIKVIEFGQPLPKTK